MTSALTQRGERVSGVSLDCFLLDQFLIDLISFSRRSLRSFPKQSDHLLLYCISLFTSKSYISLEAYCSGCTSAGLFPHSLYRIRISCLYCVLIAFLCFLVCCRSFFSNSLSAWLCLSILSLNLPAELLDSKRLPRCFSTFSVFRFTYLQCFFFLLLCFCFSFGTLIYSILFLSYLFLFLLLS